MNPPPKGALLLDELIIPIIDILFVDEAVVIVAELSGPIKAGSAKRYVVNGQDGRTLFSGVCDQSWPDLSAWHRLRTQMAFNVTGKTVLHEAPKARAKFVPWNRHDEG